MSREELTEFVVGFMSQIPFHIETGITITEATPGSATMRLPYDPRFVGNPDTGILHGGIVTALLDACAGLSVFLSLERPLTIATLDLRIDYLRPAVPHQAVIAKAECYRKTSQVAFARATAFHEDPEKIIATCAGTFMLATKNRHSDRKESGT